MSATDRADWLVERLENLVWDVRSGNTVDHIVAEREK